MVFEFSDELALRSFQAQSGFRYFVNALLVLGLPTGCAIGVSWIIQPKAGRILAVVAAVVGMLFTALYWLRVRKGLAAWRTVLGKLQDRKVKLSISNEAVVIEGCLAPATISWDRLTALRRFTHAWQLEFATTACVIPRELIDEELSSFLSHKVRAAGAYASDVPFLASNNDPSPVSAPAKSTGVNSRFPTGSLAFALIAIFSAFMGFRSQEEFSNGRASQTWPQAQASLVRIQVGVRSRPSNDLDFFPDAEYEYSVAGRRFRGSTVRFCPIASEDMREIEAIIDKILAIVPFQIRYDPKDPSRSVILPGVAAETWESILRCGAFSAIFAICAVAGFLKWRRHVLTQQRKESNYDRFLKKN